MKFSCIVPTVGRPDQLQRFIDHLLLQASDRVDLRDVELLVVDQSGNHETAELLSRQQVPFRIRHLPMQGRGASRARNYGWSLAQGELLTFPDDDCHYPRGLLHQVLEIFDNREIDGLMVQVEHLGRQDQTSGPIIRGNVLQRCVESGLFFRRHLFGDVRYDERMGVGADTPWNSDEGPDLLLRALKHGLRLDYEPRLVIHHPNPLATPDQRLLQRCYSYSRGRGYLLRKHRFPLSSIVETMLRSLVGCLVMALTARPYWARYYWNAFLGKWQGLRGGWNAPAQLVTSPLLQAETAEFADVFVTTKASD